MEFINISHKNYFKCSAESVSSELDKNHSIHNIFNNGGYWSSIKSEASSKEFFVIKYGSSSIINFIEMDVSQNGLKTFPKNFRIEVSTDRENWKILHSEKNLKLNDTTYKLDIPLTEVEYIKFIIQETNMIENYYYAEIGSLRTGISGINEINASSSKPGKEPKNLLEGSFGSFWESNESKSGKKETLNIDLGKVYHINRISLASSDTNYPENISVDASADNNIWKPIFEENNFTAEPKRNYYWDIDLIPAQFIKIEMKRSSAISTESTIKLSELIIYSAKFNTMHTHNIGEQTPYASIFQAGVVKLARDGEETLGTSVQGSDRRLRDANTIFKGIVQLAADGDNTKGLVVQANDKRLKDADELSPGIVRLGYNRESKKGIAVQSNDSRLKEATEENFGIVKICPDGSYNENSVVTGNDSRIQVASFDNWGIVKLAKDGESSTGTVVQGNDKRLKDATISSKGIVELAGDGEKSEGVVVQGNDRRLKDATISSKGIVELAQDSEDAEGVVVQGNDKRLKDATITSKGIVELAGDGEDKAGVVVQANDKRLKDGTIKNSGIVRFANNGESAPNAAVQGNDKRLKNATTTFKGIVQLAEDGREAPGMVVQADDKRLKKATEISAGIVELAENGEDRKDVVVQGNDKRLKPATVETGGIIRLAKDGEERTGSVIQSTDSRLNNARPPLSHEHNYAKKEHDYNDHSGTIFVKADKNENFQGITPPSDNSSVIHGENLSNTSSSIGISGVAGKTKTSINSYGVVGHSSHIGVRGQSTGQDNKSGAGVLGISRFGSGGVFASEHSYSLIADGYGSLKNIDNSLNLIGNGDALKVNGKSQFTGEIHLNSKESDSISNIVEYFEVDESEFISPGALLKTSNQGNSILEHSRKEYDRSIIGIISGNPSLILNNSGKTKKIYPIALTGKVMCKIDARKNPVNPGDIIVSSNTPGCGMAGTIDSFEKVGTIVGKALDSLSDGIGVIPVFVTNS